MLIIVHKISRVLIDDKFIKPFCSPCFYYTIGKMERRKQTQPQAEISKRSSPNPFHVPYPFTTYARIFWGLFLCPKCQKEWLRFDHSRQEYYCIKCGFKIGFDEVVKHKDKFKAYFRPICGFP